MEHIPEKDRQRVRNLARRQLEFANAPENAVILKKWDALANGRRETPTVRLLFSKAIPHRKKCQIPPSEI